MVRRFAVYLVCLDPTLGREMKKTRPCVVISPDEMNGVLGTVIIAPLTSAKRNVPTRVPCEFEGKLGEVVLDQIRVVDKRRLAKELGFLKPFEVRDVQRTLLTMFS